MSYLSSVSPKYQVTIPKRIRSKFPSIRPFGKVTVSEKNGSIIIRPKKSIVDLVGIMGIPPVSGKGKTFDQIRKEAYDKLRKF